MFVIGAVAGVVGVGVLAHDDYSDYSDWREYSDAARIQEIEEAEAKKDRLERDLSRTENELEQTYSEKIEKLREKYGDTVASGVDNAGAFIREKDYIIQNMEKDLDKEAKEAQREINRINAAIAEINNVQLIEKK